MRTALAVALICADLAVAGPLEGARRIVFLGDSNTYAGRFIAYLDVHRRCRHPDQAVELVNLGLPSETVSGLSEPDHPYPRPNVHDRLAAALAKSKPDVVVAGYGMNDGIYYPFDEGRFRKYQDGYRRLIADCEKAGAKVVLLTPAPFDPTPLRGKTQPAGADKYSWLRPFDGYDDVLAGYSGWLTGFRGRNYAVADAHTALRGHIARMRKADSGYRVSADGIHPDANGHFIIFRELAAALGMATDGPAAAIDAAAGESKSPGVSGVKVTPGRLEFTWETRLPFPRDPAWHRRLADVEGLAAGPTRFRLTVAGLPPGRHTLYEGDRLVGMAAADEWKAGVDLGRWPDLSANKRAVELLKVIEERTRVLGLAWLSDIGHRRPDTPKGLPLAEAQARVTDLERRAAELAAPVRLQLRLVPAK
jgi:lysophospholipase L1-like esterase